MMVVLWLIDAAFLIAGMGMLGSAQTWRDARKAIKIIIAAAVAGILLLSAEMSV